MGSLNSSRHDSCAQLLTSEIARGLISQNLLLSRIADGKRFYQRAKWGKGHDNITVKYINIICTITTNCV